MVTQPVLSGFTFSNFCPNSYHTPTPIANTAELENITEQEQSSLKDIDRVVDAEVVVLCALKYCDFSV